MLSFFQNWEREDGRKEGQEDGRLAEKPETARKMLADGLEPVIIMKYTGLSYEEFVTLSSTQD